MLTSIIRTVVPVVVAVIVTAALKIGVDLPAGAVEEIVTAVVAGVYYTVARWLEERVDPVWGRLLGRVGAPIYVPNTAESAEAGMPEVQ